MCSFVKKTKKKQQNTKQPNVSDVGVAQPAGVAAAPCSVCSELQPTTTTTATPTCWWFYARLVCLFFVFVLYPATRQQVLISCDIGAKGSMAKKKKKKTLPPKKNKSEKFHLRRVVFVFKHTLAVCSSRSRQEDPRLLMKAVLAVASVGGGIPMPLTWARCRCPV